LRKAPFATFGGRNPTDRGRNGVKWTLLVDKKGAPLLVDIFPANLHDSKTFFPMLKKMRASQSKRVIVADSAFDAESLRVLSKKKNICLQTAPNRRRKKNKGVPFSHLPYRWIVEQTFGIFSWLRGLKTCWAKTRGSALGFLKLACAFRLFKLCGWA